MPGKENQIEVFLELIILFKSLFYVQTYFLHKNFSIISALTELNFFQIISEITIDFSTLTSLFHVCFSLTQSALLIK